MSPGPRSSRPSVGVMLQRHVDPALIPHRARLFESLGFDDVWVVEDRYFSGGIAQAGAVLSATERLDVGIGNLPAVVRNPVFAAMELATLAGIYPGRLIAGIQVGVLPT